MAKEELVDSPTLNELVDIVAMAGAIIAADNAVDPNLLDVS